MKITIDGINRAQVILNKFCKDTNVPEEKREEARNFLLSLLDKDKDWLTLLYICIFESIDLMTLFETEDLIHSMIESRSFDKEEILNAINKIKKNLEDDEE